MTAVHYIEAERKGRDRADLKEYKVKMSFAFCFNNENHQIEYYHNSSFLEHGGAPDKAVRNAFVYAIDQYIKAITESIPKTKARYSLRTSPTAFCSSATLCSTMTSYENQTKKAITNKFMQDAMTEFLREHVSAYILSRIKWTPKSFSGSGSCQQAQPRKRRANAE